ncbi:MATE family efflux transporter [Azoarcus sp. DN11]|uniref:MATE family efflux transporter n=1 Tax=Azoarcus sp. DN11 TaxID=356837 RepID=UPI000EAF164D|nr:MATE family efflux transporter [Azoarcus sp. DN11]AYH43204.1 MATE family efflux transporter [Azoarcus sp. DN11]
MSPSSSSHASPSTIVRQLLHHAWPILVAQILSMSMLIADTIIVGRYGTVDLAAIAVGSGVYISIVMLVVGVLQAVAPTVAHHFGAGRMERIGPTLQQGFWLALMLAVPGIVLMVFPGFLLELSSVPPDVDAKTREYLLATAAGLPAVLLYRTFYAFNNAVGKPRVLMAISFIVTATHVPLAWALVHGHLWLPPLGVLGCGISTAIVNWLAFACGTVHLARNPGYQPYHLFAHWRGPQPGEILSLLRLGVPMGLSTFIEVSSFTLIALFAARLGAEAVAGHRVVANLAALIYMLPLAMSIAVLVLVGQAAGARDWARARMTVRVGMIVTGSLASLIGIAMWLARKPVIALFSEDEAVRAIGLALLLYICIYQLFDSVQTVAAHALRGYKVTFVPMLMHAVCFWGVGLAGGYWASFHAPWRTAGPHVAGFWEAGVMSTVVAAVLFGWLLRAVMRRQDLPAAP